MKILLRIFIMIVLIYGCAEKESPVGERVKEKKHVSTEVTPIVKILEDPAGFKGKDVTIKGVVEPGLAFEFVNEQPFKVKDDTGEIWVITTSIMPEKESTIVVTGTVSAPYQIKGRRYDVAIIEKERR